MPHCRHWAVDRIRSSRDFILFDSNGLWLESLVNWVVAFGRAMREPFGSCCSTFQKTLLVQEFLIQDLVFPSKIEAKFQEPKVFHGDELQKAAPFVVDWGSRFSGCGKYFRRCFVRGSVKRMR